MTNIKFGTDGWRGVIADDFTFDNVRRVAGSDCLLRLSTRMRRAEWSSATTPVSLRSRRPVIAAESAREAGIPVRSPNDYAPTPAISSR